MGSFNSHKLQPGKKPNNTILKHRHLRKIANLLRYVEFCVVLVLVSRLSIQLPVAVKNSSEYFQGFSVFMASPCFVFLLGNAIIATLFVQSGQFSAQGSGRDSNPESDIYHEFLQNSIVSYKNQKIQAEKTEHPRKQSILENSITNYKSQKMQAEKTEHPQKQSARKTEVIKEIQNIDCDQIKNPEKAISTRAENNKKVRSRNDGCLIKYREKQSTKPATTKTEDQKIDGEKITKVISLEVKDYKRCQSENTRHVQSEKPLRLLHRSESEKTNRGSNELANSSSFPEDGMSNDEFRRTIEAFIARQQRLRKQEQCFITA